MTTEERLEKLERELARIQAGGPDNEVRARRFVLIDEHLAAIERQLAEMQTELRTHVTRMQDENSNAGATVGVDQDRPRLSCLDEKGETRAGLDAAKIGPSVILHDDNGETVARLPVGHTPELECKLATRIADLGLSARAENILICEDIINVGQLVRLNEDDLLALTSFGKISLRDVKRKLADLGLSLPDFLSERRRNKESSVTTEAYPAWRERLGVVERELADIKGGVAVLQEVRANRIVLVDENGKCQAMLFTDDDGARLILDDEYDQTSACLAMGKNGPGLYLTDENGTRVARMIATKDGPALSMHDENGEVRAWLGATKDGPGLALLDKNGKPIWQAP
ncbi:MAG: DNA-directed RNA polymerase subunit alpha C-terminal domain-containing protein [Phycisphaerae bacterium]